MKRYITLYYASIGLMTSLWALMLWCLTFWLPRQKNESRLRDLLERTYSKGAWFFFGSARGGLAAVLKAAGIGPGDEVLISAYTCLAVPTAVVASGAKPVYVDIDAQSLTPNKDQIVGALTEKTKAIIVQHTLGIPAAIAEIKKGLENRNLLLIEDCALSIGTSIDGKYVGTFADASIFSMELSKTISCGWGGLLLVNRPELAQSLEKAYAKISEQTIGSSFKDLFQTVVSAWSTHPSFAVFPGKYIMWLCVRSGLFRYSTPQAEFDAKLAPDFVRKMGDAQLILARLQWHNFGRITDACHRNYITLKKALLDLSYQVHYPGPQNISPVTNRISFLVSDRDHIMAYFKHHRVTLGAWFDGPLSPVPKASEFNYQVGQFTKAESVAKHVVNIPCHSRLTTDDLNRIIQLLKSYTETFPNARIV